MEEMAHIVDATLRRIDVDLAQDEVALSMQAFRLQSWETPEQRSKMRQRLCTLCRIFHLPEKMVVPVLSACGKTLLQLVKGARPTTVDNRQAWSWLLHSTWRARQVAWNQHCETLVAFYLCLKINTTSLERDLGLLLTHLTAHSGPTDPTGGSIASILEVRMEGPQSPEEFFAPADMPGGPLTPTEFGHLCAKLWIQHFGRRFRYSYDKGKDGRADSKPKAQRPRLKGTFASIGAARADATSKLAACGKRRESFVPGITLPMAPSLASRLEGSRWGPPPAQSGAAASLSKFNKHTERKKQRDLAHPSFGPHGLFNSKPKPGHAERASARQNGRAPYVPTDMRY